MEPQGHAFDGSPSSERPAQSHMVHHPTPNPRTSHVSTNLSQSSLMQLRSAASTPMSPVMSSTFHSSSNPRLAAPLPALPALPVHSQSESVMATVASMVNSLHPLQDRKVRETHKALIESNGLTGRKLINQYEVIEELGRGMHGKVKLARNTETGENVAIKIIPRFSKKRRLGKVVAMSPLDKTQKEIAILKKIRHENVVALLEVIDDPELKKIYMVLEHVELGEIVWRKKGLSSVCLYERRRIEREMRGDPMSEEEERYIQRRAALNGIKRARQAHVGSTTTGEFWSLEYGPADDASPASQSRVASRDSLADLNLAVSSHPASLQASRSTSRAPSRSQSVRSLGNAAAAAAAALADQNQEQNRRDHVETIPPSIRPANQASSSSAALENAVLLPSSYIAEDNAAFRGRSPSMADSIISHMSSVDYNHLVAHDPFHDDYSYVPCFSLDQARTAFRDTVLGLEYLHYQGVVHRDIKPANLLWTRDHHVKISDFGVSYFGRPIREGEVDDTVSESEARDFDDDLELAKTVGTPAFFAPELCYTDPDKAQPKVSEQIDVWSLGVTLYCLVYARIPFLAEDEFQMFKKIANDDVYIPARRLRPVDPQTSVDLTSLSRRQSLPPPYRDDADLLYEEVGPQLHDLLFKMLVKNPEQRIKLRDIKRHPWVLQGIPNHVGWLDDTDPGRSSGRRIQVDEREMKAAVVPLTFLERARSVAKSITRSAVDKTMNLLSDRAEGRSRRRAASSAASSAGGGDGTASAVSSMPQTPRDFRRRSFRGEENLHHHNGRGPLPPPPPPPPPYTTGDALTRSHNPSESSSATEVGYDPMATVVLPSDDLPSSFSLSSSSSSSSSSSPSSSSRPLHLNIPPMSPPSTSEKAFSAASPSDHHHHHHHHQYNQDQARSPAVQALGSLHWPQYRRPLSSMFSSPSGGSLAAAEVQTVPSTPYVDGNHEETTAQRKPRDTATSDMEASRSRSVDRALFSVADKRAQAQVGVTPVLAPGSLSLAPMSIHRARHPRPMRSVDLSSAMAHANSPSPASPLSFSPRSIDSYLHGLTSSSDPDMRRQRAQTDAKLHHHVPPRSEGADERRMTLPHVAASPGPASPALIEHGFLPRRMNSPQRQFGLPTADVRSIREDYLTLTAKSSSSTSMADANTPLVNPGEATGPISVTGSSGLTAATFNKGSVAHGSADRMAQMSAFQSDPSLPALLSGASSVSADLEGDLLGRPGVVGTSSLLDSTDSLTPPAFAREPTGGFPLGAAFGDRESVVKTRIGMPTTPGTMSATSTMSSTTGITGPASSSLAYKGTSQPAVNLPLHGRPTPLASVHSKSAPAVEEDDSDSDEGLVMAQSRKKRADDSTAGNGSEMSDRRRRNTNTSTGSSDTAKKVARYSETASTQ